MEHCRSWQTSVCKEKIGAMTPVDYARVANNRQHLLSMWLMQRCRQYGKEAEDNLISSELYRHK